MRISDWSSDVCSSDLPHRRVGGERRGREIRVGANAPLRPGEHRLDAIEIGEEVRARAEESAARVLEVLRRGEQFVFVGLARLEIGEGRGEFRRSEEHTSELQSLMRLSYAVFCLKQKTKH